MTINLADNTPRVSYAVAQGATQTSFTVSFEFFDAADLNVYVDGTLKTITTHYTVSGGDGSTGTVTMSVTGATGGSTVVITRDIDLKRTTDFPASGSFQIGSLNTELDKLVAIAADLDDKASRALQLTDFDTAVSLVLPDVNTRKGKTLAFNASTGAVEAGPSTSDVQTVSATAADIAALADIEDGTTATDAISGLAAIKANVTTVAGISSNVTTVAGISSNVTAVAGDASDIGTVASNISSVNTNATNISAIQGAAANASTATTKASEAASSATAAAASATTATTQASTATTQASTSTTKAGEAATSATASATSATASATSATASASSATAAAASQTAAASSAAAAATALDSFDDRYLGVKSSNPTQDNDGNALVSGALYFNDSANEMRVYDGANWIAATSAGNVSLILYEYTATSGQTTFSGSDDNSATLSYTVDNLQVVMSGVILDPSDYTATNGTSVVLAAGAATNDLVNIYAFKSFTTADMVSKTNGGTFAGSVGFSGGATFPDSAELVFGTGSDFKISHNGSKTKIEDTGTGNLEIRGTNIEFYSGDGGETLAKLTDDGAAELYHNNTKRIETSSTGVDITGGFTATDGCTITTADNDPQLTLVSTDADGSRGPELLLYRNSASPANGDALGFIRWDGENDSGAQHEYIKFEGLIAASSGAASGAEQAKLDIRTMVSGTDRSRIDIDYDGTVINQEARDLDFRVESNSASHMLMVNGGDNRVGINIDPSDANVVSTGGESLVVSGAIGVVRSQAAPIGMNRLVDDGDLIVFRAQGVLEGTISISGTTVSYNGGHLSRYSQLSDNTKDTSIVKGTVMTNLDQMAEWTKDGVTEENEQLNCMAVSSVEGDANVAGVFVNWDDDDEDYANDMNIAMTGDMVIRIAQGTTVARGDLLMSAGHQHHSFTHLRRRYVPCALRPDGLLRRTHNVTSKRLSRQR